MRLKNFYSLSDNFACLRRCLNLEHQRKNSDQGDGTRLNIRYLLIFMPIAIIAWAQSLGPQIIFILSMMGLIPLAAILAESTEVLAYKTGPKIGSLLNATFGNAVDLILLFALLRSG